jgi:hypothetical protein
VHHGGTWTHQQDLFDIIQYILLIAHGDNYKINVIL